MSVFVIATIKSWNIENARTLQKQFPGHRVVIVTEKKRLTCDYLQSILPQYIFFPHWSWIIPEEIYRMFSCVVFHMTDLPFGRGGSPLQNLLVRGIYQTKISAIKVGAGLDTGPIYMQEPLDISEGNADEIFKRASDIIFQRMIPRFFEGAPVPTEQTGEPTVFLRRTPEQSEIPKGLSKRALYDYIRMLDGEGYPPAYVRYRGGRICFRNARLTEDAVYADAQFEEEWNDEEYFGGCGASGR